ncbi:pre-mRNA-splicing factor syf1 [Exophiala aquamarina CBS 119918]|uniref:Pre-mRNA-splicing factor SYF1 n=1 Tax=Exophiala aquamarina CBS 119918 TaxID=1182545 RepID=A0A072P8Z9_9EURO|nr:pre-mRNA-splicing factor syf1 [Exophiala aquamarina CBS 119918]KEF55743.1 pre-mRNA-splicing factor syf1 [Exophiala aquamarina CBS 119918]
MPGIVRVPDSRSTVSMVPSHSLKPDFYLIASEDAIYEQDVLRNPGSIRPWLTYIDYKMRNGTIHEQAFVQERACIRLPRSYKLWKMYLSFRVKHLKKKNPVKYRAEFTKVNALFERALVLLNKMPVVWEMYLTFLLRQPYVTKTRRTFDRALRALPITQHNRIWKLYKSFANSASGETAVKIWARYVQAHPEDVEDYIDLLVDNGHYLDAVKQYIRILDNPKFKSKHIKSEFQLWSEMVELMVSKARELGDSSVSSFDADTIIRSGIERFADQRGKLWAGLATYWITRGDFERARDVFEEGVTTVMTVRDFTMIFDAYVEFEESILSTLMDAASIRAAKGVVDAEKDYDVDMRMMRFEHLMDRRPFLVNDVLLRQNPNNVVEWQKRVALWSDNKEEVVQTYTDAIAAIAPKRAIGKFHELWLNYAKFYEEAGDLETARLILDKSVKVPYKSVAELAETWVGWAEMELRNDNFDGAMKVMAKAVQAPKRSTVEYFDETLSPQQRVHKSWKVWSFYIDLVESVGTLDEARAAYDRVLELRIATPNTIVNYANLLEEAGYYEESFKVYERGLDVFSYPVAFELWNLYLTKAVNHKIGIERLRDLFEQAVENCPPEFAKAIYLMYGDLEEERGLARSAMRVYERATRSVSDGDRLAMFEFYISKSASNFGLTSTRPIYERAIAALPDAEAKAMCLKFAEMERRLGEIDRARAIYGHASQFADPRVDNSFWVVWEKFEVAHGNEDTFKEMLRVKRSVAAKFNTDVNYIASQAVKRGQAAVASTPDAGDQDEPDRNVDAMAALERQARAPVGFVAASSGPEGGNQPPASKQEEKPVTGVAANPDAIDVDIEDDDD